MPRPLRRLPGFASRPTVSRLTSVRAVRRPPSRCAASTGSWCGRRACVSAPSRTPCSTPSTPTRVDAPAGGFYVSAVPLSLHNTLTRRLEPFQPLAPPRVTLYTCGPTVWNYAHLGNFRTFLFEDLLRRYLEASGYDVFHIMNLTDVDDRTIKAARAAGTTRRRHTEPFVGAAWDAPFGRGRPGWHLECSAMSLYEVGTRFGVETLDIHAGGVDLIFPHHEDEIAQSEAATGRPFARWWLHGEFLNVRGTKMSKRFGNFLAARDLREQGVDAAALRLLFWQTHYRKPPDFTDEALAAAGAGGAAAAAAAVARAMAVLDVLPTPRTADPDLARWIEAQVAARERARKSKDFKEADRIRGALLARGVELEDTPTGTKWRVV